MVVNNILDVRLKKQTYTHTYTSGSHNSIGMEVSNSLTFIGNWMHNATSRLGIQVQAISVKNKFINIMRKSANVALHLTLK